MKTLLLSLTYTLLIGSLLSCFKKENNGKLTIKGSDTMVHLTSAWAQEYMKTNVGKLSVTGGGSGTGIAALLNRSTDVAIASRKIKDKEVVSGSKKELQIQELPVAADGISIVVNPSNPIKSLTLAQVEKIYTGIYTNWKQLGGPNLEIVPFSRENSSGTYVFFQKKAMSKKDYHKSIRRFPSNSAILNTVASNKGAIGYVGLGYYLKAIGKVSAVKLDGILPTLKTISTKKYPLSRYLFFYYAKNKVTKATRDFIAFVLSSEGQQLVSDAGFVSVKE